MLDFIGVQALAANPFNLPIWLTGLGCLLFAPFLARFRLLGVQSLAVLAFLAWSAPRILHYPAPVYAVLFAAGAVALERWAGRRVLRLAARPALVVLLLFAGAVGMPLAIPILPEEEVEPYVVELGIEPPEVYGREHHAFPQQFSTMLAWPDVVEATARAWSGLPASERDAVAILGVSYSDAGAVDLFGPRYGLPSAISGHNAYADWGARNYDLEAAIVVGAGPEIVGTWWHSAVVLETVPCARCESWRQEIPVVLARDPRFPMPELWEQLRHY